MNEVKINRCYKDRLFVKLFGDPARARDALDLYNAVNETNYTDTKDLEFYTIENAVYMSMKNDVALCFESILNLFEHQSTLNPNMPVRGLMYFGKLYDKYIAANELNIYSGKLQVLPTPRYFVFYNGTEDAPEKEILRLTDAFAEPAKSSIEVTATVYNINFGRNRELMEKCRTLAEYSTFVDRVRQNKEKTKDIRTAVNEAVDSCIRDGILADFLTKHKAEVMDVVLTEYDEEKHMKMVARDAKADGMAKGEIKGAIKVFRLNSDLSDREIADKIMELFSLSEDEALENVQMYK